MRMSGFLDKRLGKRLKVSHVLASFIRTSQAVKKFSADRQKSRKKYRELGSFMTDRFSSHESVKWNKGAFEDGAEARIVFNVPITAAPSPDVIGKWCHDSWRAGWADADQDLLSRTGVRGRAMSDRKFTPEIHWIETNYGSRWMSTPSPRKYQIWRMTCVHCEFYIDPGTFRTYQESRTDHPFPYGNMASISHARKLMKEHVEEKHQGG